MEHSPSQFWLFVPDELRLGFRLLGHGFVQDEVEEERHVGNGGAGPSVVLECDGDRSEG